jgi:hypothetical protein
MGILLVIVAGCFTSLSNFCMRRSIDSGGTSKAYLMIQLTFATIVALLIGPIRTQEFAVNGSIAVLGLGAGLILGIMLLTLGRAMEKGPPGLTIAVLNAATVMPAIVMATIFGAAFGFIYTPWHAFGSLLVLAGLFWAGKGLAGLQDKRAWLLFVTMMFACHLLFLVIMQWRALVLNWPHPDVLKSMFSSQEMASQWFMPFIYLAAAALQTVIYLSSERRIPNAMEAFYGFIGGATNSLSTFFLIWATEVSSSLENIVIFPIFSVSVIVICNLWGQRLYQEQVNWKACQVCALGLLIGTIDWKALMGALGW